MNKGKIKKLTVCLIIASVLACCLFALTVGAEKATCNIVSVNDGSSNIGYTVHETSFYDDATGIGKHITPSILRSDLIFNTDMPNAFGVGDIVTVNIELAVPREVTQGAISIGGVYYYINTWQAGTCTFFGNYYYASFSVTRSFPEAVSNQGIYLYIHADGGLKYLHLFDFYCSINNDPSIAIGNAADKINNNNNNNTNQIKANQDKNTEKILGAGDGVSQPDFDGTNSNIDGTTSDINQIEGDYQIDTDEVQSSLSEFDKFSKSADMNRASIQVKKWIERFFDDNTVVSGFLVAVMCLSLCFWVIGRKAGR